MLPGKGWKEPPLRPEKKRRDGEEAEKKGNIEKRNRLWRPAFLSLIVPRKRKTQSVHFPSVVGGKKKEKEERGRIASRK